jgi:hypothetical protein
LDCPLSLLKLPHVPLAAEIAPVCGRRVSVRGPPPEGFRDPWPGATLAGVGGAPVEADAREVVGELSGEVTSSRSSASLTSTAISITI